MIYLIECLALDFIVQMGRGLMPQTTDFLNHITPFSISKIQWEGACPNPLYNCGPVQSFLFRATN